MTDEEKVSQALAELWDIVKCRCNEAYTGRGLHDPDCECDSTDALQIVTDRIKTLTAERDDYALKLMRAINTYTEMHLDIERLSDKLATCEKYRDAYAEMGRIGTQAVRDLEAKLAKAVEALEPFARAAETWEPDDGDSGLGARIEHPHHGLERHAEFTFGDLRRARATLAEIKGESHD